MPLGEARPTARFNFDFDSKCETLKDIKTQILTELALYRKPTVEYPLSFNTKDSESDNCCTSSSSILRRLGFGKSH